MKALHSILYIACILLPLAVKGQNEELSRSTRSCSATQRLWLWGVGRANVLDTYLSPLEYTGTNFSMLHNAERMARWGKNHVTTYSLYTAHVAYMHSPTDDGKEWDSELTAAGGWHYNFYPSSHLRFAAGGLAELSGGFTYNTRGTNNPAQGRLGLSIAASGIAEYSFVFFRKMAKVHLQADAQLMGIQFSPEYGQSYYEIFSLGHNSGVVHFTQPANCPSFRLQALVTLPIGGAKFTLGYLGDIRQSTLGGLKRHAWRNGLMIGYTRHLNLSRE